MQKELFLQFCDQIQSIMHQVFTQIFKKVCSFQQSKCTVPCREKISYYWGEKKIC